MTLLDVLVVAGILLVIFEVYDSRKKRKTKSILTLLHKWSYRFLVWELIIMVIALMVFLIVAVMRL